MGERASSRCYDYLINSLRDPEEAAVYLEVTLEEEDWEPKLFRKALENVAEALGGDNLSPEESKLLHEKLDQVLANSGSATIYGFVQWQKC